MRLAGKAAIVTGSSRGIGRAIAVALAGEGAAVVVCGSGSGAGGVDEVVEVITASGGSAIGIEGPLEDPSFAQSMVERCVSELGGLDIVVNNAGIYSPDPVHECSIDAWQRVMRVNVDAVFHLCRAALPHMMEQQWGRIINAGSSAGIGKMGSSAYPASKSAVFGLTRAIASDYGPYGITANCYNPEALTAMSATADQAAFEAVIRRYETKGYTTPAETEHLLGVGGPEGVAPWVTFLCTEGSDQFNGEIFAVDGRRVALLGWPDEDAGLYRDAERQGSWSVEELERLGPRVFPVANRWPRREGEALRNWENA